LSDFPENEVAHEAQRLFRLLRRLRMEVDEARAMIDDAIVARLRQRGDNDVDEEYKKYVL
jgi:hypothetical protein